MLSGVYCVAVFVVTREIGLVFLLSIFSANALTKMRAKTHERLRSNDLSNKCSGPIAITFYLKHHLDWGKAAFALEQIGSEPWFLWQQIGPIRLYFVSAL